LTHLAGSSRLLRAMNEIAALSHLLDRGELTRAELRELTGLSKPTISEAVRRLTDAGLVVVVGHVSAGPGPNAEVYAANPDAAYVIAVSVRDTFLGERTSSPSLAAAVCDVSGTVRGRVEAPIDFERDDPVAAVGAIVDQLRAQVDASGIGYVQIGVAGAYDPLSGIIHHVDVPGWGRPGLVAELGRRIGLRVEVDNDVNLAAAAERRRGVAADAEGFALLWLGEGLGLAIDLGGTLLRGARGGAGEIGYMPLYNLNGERRADLQDLIGGQAVLDLAAEYGLPGQTPAEAVASAAGSANAAPFFAALAERIAVGLAAVVAVLDPPLVVLGGEVAQAGGVPLRDAVREAMAANAPLETTVEITAVTEDHPVLLGGLDAGLAAVRDVLLASLRN
jgi:predicted NBD/HSP70 family sugar kinase/DNA-binding transcriptional ArsR family regulator